jgi:class 3 adenylate cyclase/tetratricopeptide (TPR) repeat protein
VTSCPSCGHENEAGARFCSQCATPLGDASPVAATERKVVTVLFADLVGFTSKAERLDPEDVQAVLKPYHERLRYELERWGGTVEKFIGDAVMALFGAPVAGENDPERAVRAALAIRDWIAEEGQLQVRIAVNTGEALVSLGARPEAGEGMAAGDVVNSAARLQSAAPTNGILVGETTYRATSERIDYREHPAVDAKGKEAAIPVWEVVQARARFGVDLTPEARTPLVGRARELDQLVDALARVREQGSPELVTLVGVPGIGKSRLVGELFQSIERGGVLTYWRQGRSLPYGDGVSYWALAEMVKAQAGILETDTDDEVEAKLERAVAQLIEEDADWVLSHLRPLVGQASDVAAGSQEEAFAAWRRFFEALAEQYALVLVFEDIQWADDGLLAFIEHLADWVSDVPILILCTARRELLERRPAWGGGKVNAATIAVAPLTDEQTAELISALGERPLLEASAQSALLDRAGGNPLYAEQYVRMLAERGSADDLPLPESVQGIIAARLDSLPLEEKALLQDAAVIGKVFWRGALGASEQQLHALQQKELVQRARRSSVAGETEYSFRHLLVRDVAYGQVPRAERARKHVRTAEWIESLGRPEDHAEMLAHHYANALELTRAAGEDAQELVPRARTAFREAGARAATLHAVPAAERYYADALALTPSDDPERPDLLLRHGQMHWYLTEEGAEEVQEARDGFLAAGDSERAAEATLFLAQVAWRVGSRDGMREHMDNATALVEGMPPSRIQAAVLCEACRYEMLAEHSDQAVELGREALRLADELGLDDIRAKVLINVGTARAGIGEGEGFRELQSGIELAQQINLIAEVIRGMNNLETRTAVAGDFTLARRMVVEIRELAQRYGYLHFVRFLDGASGVIHPYVMGEWDLAVERANAFTRAVEEGAPHYQAPHSYSRRSLISLARGDDAAALIDTARALDLARPVGDPQVLIAVLLDSARVYAETGHEADAIALFDEALALLRELPSVGFSVFPSHTLAWLARVLGREADVEELFSRETAQSRWLDVAKAVLSGDLHGAADILADIDAPAFEAFYRLHAGNEEDVRAALAFYRGVRATRYVREGEALLAISA